MSWKKGSQETMRKSSEELVNKPSITFVGGLDDLEGMKRWWK